MSGQIPKGKNTRRAGMDAERLSWECFRFEDDSRKWRQLAQERRAYFVTAANRANPDGTDVKISAKTFSKAAGKRSTAFNRLSDLEAMGVCLPELHTDDRGKERERLTEFHGTRLRRLRYEPLEAAQRLLDSGQEFKGHKRLGKEEQRDIQRAWLKESKLPTEPAKESQIHPVKESKIDVKESSIDVKESKIACEGVQPYVGRNRRSLTEEPIPPPTVDWAGRMQALYGKSGVTIPSGIRARGENADAILARIDADGLPLVEQAWKLILDRDFGGLTRTTVMNVFLTEYDEWKVRAESQEPEIDLTEFKAQLDRQNEAKRIAIMSRKPEPVPTAEDLFGEACTQA
jgi:hypothetical protein